MRKLAIAMALASTALATPAVARDKSVYVGVEGGAMILEDMSLDVGTFNNAENIDYKLGLDTDLVFGYDFGAVRAEGELGYKRAAADRVLVANANLTAPRGTVNGGVGQFDAGGRASAMSAMANVLLDFGDDDGWSGYVGAGAGVAHVKLNSLSAGTFADFLDDSDTNFAWQAIAGVRTALSPNLDLGLKYRLFNVSNLRFTDEGLGSLPVGGRNVRTRWRSHSLLASLIYNFAAPPLPPPPPPVVEVAPPPPPPPATQTCPDGSVILATDVCPAPPPPPPPPPPEPVRG